MFGKNKNADPLSHINSDVRPQQSGSQAKPSKNEPVYTMPEKFMQSDASGEKGGGKKRMLLLVAIILAVAAIIAAVSVFFLQQYGGVQPAADTNATTATQQAPTAGLGTLVTPEEPTNSDVTGIPENGSTTSINLDVDPTLEQNINAELFGNTNDTVDPLNLNANENISSGAVDHSDVPDSADKDKDDLTDLEEELYTTKNHLPDNDRDGYVDGVEVANLYSPLAADESILDSGLVIEYENDVVGWTLYYPSDWLVEPLNGTKQEVIVTSPSAEGEFFQLLVEKNTSALTAVEWYDALFEEGGEDLETVEIGELEGVVSEDGLRYYFASGDELISIVYNIGLQEEIAFRTTFQMMVNSFVYTGPAEGTELLVEVTPDGGAVGIEDDANTNEDANQNENTNESGLNITTNVNSL